MSGICESLLKADIATDCDSMVTKGFEQAGIIINRAHIDFSKTVFDATNKDLIKTLVLTKGNQGYAIVCPGSTPFTGTKTTLKKGTYKNSWEHEIPVVVLDNGPAVCANVIEGLANGTFVVILKNKFKGADGSSEYQVYGYYQGLIAESIENDKYSEDTDGGWKCTLKETGAPKAAMFYFNTDSATTATQFETLKTAVTA
jgi:hypothetical protein